MSSVQTAKTINVSKLQFSGLKTLGNQSKTVYVNYEGGKLRVQTPLMVLPYGVGDNEKINAANPNKKDEVQAKRYDINVSFRGMETTPRLQEMYDKMREIETRVIDEVFANRQTWLRDDYDGVKSFVAKLFTPIVKHDKNKDTGKVENKYPPTMKIKIPYDEKTDVFNFACSDMDGEDLDFKSCLTKLKGAKTKLIMELGGIWFAGQRYGCSWKVIRAKFDVLDSTTSASFIPDSDDEDEVPGRRKKPTQHLEYDEDLENEALTHVPSPVVAKPSSKGKAPALPPPPIENSEDEVDDDEPVHATVSQALQDDDEGDEEDADEESDEEDNPVPPPPPPPPAPAKTRKVTKPKA
jgi:hypothetical protein